jgi:hypothetical protein
MGYGAASRRPNRHITEDEGTTTCRNVGRRTLAEAAPQHRTLESSTWPRQAQI